MTLPVLHSRPVQPGQGTRPYAALQEIEQLHQRMNELVGTILGSSPLGDGAWTPLADITETDDAYLVDIELPGVNRKDLSVEVAGSQLRVSGQIVQAVLSLPADRPL